MAGGADSPQVPGPEAKGTSETPAPVVIEAMPASMGPGPEAPQAGEAETAGVRGAVERLGYGIRANSKVGLAILMLAAGAAWVGWGALHQESPAPPASRLDSGSEVASDLTVPTSPAYREAVVEGDAERRDEAIVEGESYVPTFQSQTQATAPMVATPVKPSALAPSAQAAQAAQARPAPVTPQPEAADPVLAQDYPVAQARGTALVRTQAREAEGAAIGTMFEDLLTRWNEAPAMQVIRYETASPGAAAPAPSAGETAAAGAAAAPPGRLLVAAGRVLYGATSVGVDSELGLPVLVEVLEKPFRGALLRGEFRQVRDRMVVRFSRLSDPRRDLDLAVDAYAVGLECQCGALAGEVDRHWFARVVLPAALGFAQAYLRATGEPDTRIVVDGEVVAEYSEDQSRERVAQGLAGAAEQAGNVVFESLPTRATVRLPRGMELGIVFVEPVREAGRGRG